MADFFDERRKSLFVSIAEFKPSDVLYDLGCGDGSLLIYAVKKGKLTRAAGFENMPSRAKRARHRIKEAGLEAKITIEYDMYDADLSKADVIFDMMPEGRDDFAGLYGRTSGIRRGTRLVKHDLPLIGFLPDKVKLPFYLMRYPFTKAPSRDEWARSVMGEKDATPDDVWRELYYFGHVKLYSKKEIQDFDSMLKSRVKQ
jgi:SAM-dependent methyltransferase